MVKCLHFWRTLKSSRVAHNHLPKESFTGICRPSFCDSTTRSLIHLKVSHMVKINYIHEVLLSEWNTCLRNLIILISRIIKVSVRIISHSPTRNLKFDDGWSNVCIFDVLWKALASLTIICPKKFLQESVDHPSATQPPEAWKHEFQKQKQKHEFHFSFFKCIIKQLLDLVFVISRIIKVSVRIISHSLRLQLITCTSTLIILDITKTSSNNYCSLSFSHRDFNCNS